MEQWEKSPLSGSGIKLGLEASLHSAVFLQSPLGRGEAHDYVIEIFAEETSCTSPEIHQPEGYYKFGEEMSITFQDQNLEENHESNSTDIACVYCQDYKDINLQSGK